MYQHTPQKKDSCAGKLCCPLKKAKNKNEYIRIKKIVINGIKPVINDVPKIHFWAKLNIWTALG